MASGVAPSPIVAAMAARAAREDCNASTQLIPSCTDAAVPSAGVLQPSASCTMMAASSSISEVQGRTEGHSLSITSIQAAQMVQVPTEELLQQVQAPTEQGFVPPHTSSALVASPAEVASWSHMSAPTLQHRLDSLRARDLTIGALAGRCPSLADWNSTPSLHSHFWACKACKITVPISMPQCTCGVAFAAVAGAEDRTQLDAVISIAHRTSYGRNLVCLQDRAPVQSSGLSVAVGAPGHRESLQGHLRRFAQGK